MDNFFTKFKLNNEKEELEVVIQNIDNGVVFRGTNLWVLILAIFVASLGLNLNSTAVIIGAMLISPLMGPIMGIGLGIGINDIPLLKKAIYNYFIASGVALTTSTIFFLISPLNEAHSEILARISPTIYDVLIALFGGLAGIIAISSKQKGNIMPGVAIATALMPPLCTAGYGLATLQLNFFYGALYLYIINTVFIALSTFIITRVLHFPYKHQGNGKAEILARRIVWLVVMATLVPSLYFGYDMVKQNKFTKKANLFISNEAHFHNDYLLSKKIDAKKRTIILVFGGKEISTEEIRLLKMQLIKYGLDNTALEIKQGFAYLSEEGSKEKNDIIAQATLAMEAKEKEINLLKSQVDSTKIQNQLSRQVFEELKIQYPIIKNGILQPSIVLKDSTNSQYTYLIFLTTGRKFTSREKQTIEKWLQTRLNVKDITLLIDNVYGN